MSDTTVEASMPTDADVPAPPSGTTHRDRQRVALRDLVALATECAATEAEIEKRYQAAIENGQREFQRANWTTDERLKQLKESAEAEYQAAIKKIELQSQAELTALNTVAQQDQQRIDVEYRSAERRLKDQVDQAVWLADSLYDGTVVRVREAVKKARELAVGQHRVVQGLAAQGLALLQLYKQEVPAAAAVEKPAPTDESAEAATFEQRRDQVQERLRALANLQIPRMFVGFRPHMAVICIVLVVGLGAFGFNWARTNSLDVPFLLLLYTVGGATGLALLVGWALWIIGKKHVRQAYMPLTEAIGAAQYTIEGHLKAAIKAQEEAHAKAKGQRDGEEREAKEKAAPMLEEIGRRRDEQRAALKARYETDWPAVEQKRTKALSDAAKEYQDILADLDQRYQRDVSNLKQRYEKYQADTKQQYEDGRRSLQRRLEEGLDRIQSPIEETDRTHGQSFREWSDPAWASWTPPTKFASMVRFGLLRVDLNQIADSVPDQGQRQLALPEPFDMPASLAFPRQASLLIQTDREGREEAIRTIQMAMTRLLTFLPAGRVRFTIIDPVGLGQNFAGFMHLADHDDALVGGRIWTDSEQIEQRLVDLTEHMETVIQKYLRNEYETIDDYNAQAGELAEPYRFLVVADLPVGFEGESMRRLASIASSGARCGVYTLIVHDLRQPLPSGAHIDELIAHSVTLVRQDGRFVWKDQVFSQFPLTLDGPPGDEFLTQVLDVVGRHAKEAKRVEVNFDTIAPTAQQFWTGSTADDLRVPIGRLGATRLQLMRLGKGVAQHVLIAGKTGSGKSTLLHVLVTNMALWYRPDEVEFYLVDFKKGVEFKVYATYNLPHARAIAVESDREFGLSVLQRIDAELSRRGTMFRRVGVQDLPAYRAATGERLPRTLLIIDEFQEFFSEDDKLAQDAALLLDRLVRQGRAFGIHVLLGSQTIGGTSGLARSTIGQMAVRIALQCSEADSQLILGDNNSAARLLSRPGESIYNDAGGLVEANSPFQISWLPDERREQFLIRIQKRTADEKIPFEPAIVFEGNAPADISRNKRLAELIDAPQWPAGGVPAAFLGDPVAIKDPTTVNFRRQSGANMLLVGQYEEAALAIMVSAMISLAAHQPRGSAIFYVMDGTPADSPLAGVFVKLKEIIPHEVRLIEWRAVPEVMAELAAEMQKRQESEQPGAPSIYSFIYGLQRYRVLRKQEEAFSFGGDEEGEKKPQADKVFTDLLREGPALGMHVLTWCDTPASIERTLDRNSVREFDNRILFQMSANDSSNLIDSPMANKLGFYRALAYSEEQGVMEKFRPYALPGREWLEQVKTKLSARK